MSRSLHRAVVACSIAVGGIAAARGDQPAWAPWDHAPPLPKPAGRVIGVKTAGELAAAVGAMQSGDTVLIAPGTYQLAGTLVIDGGKKNVAIRGATGRRDDVVIRGPGMANKAVTHGIYVGKAEDVLLADFSIGDVFNHPIMLQGPAGCARVQIYNCRLFDAGEQFVKASPKVPDGSTGGVDDCAVRYCVIEYTDRARDWYTEGIDVHAGSRWVVSDNLFRNIRGPKGARLTGAAIDFWNRSRDVVVERNAIVNCEVGIRIGVLDRKGYDDASGGIVRNNFIWRAKDACFVADVGIAVNDAPGVKVLHNTVILEDGYPNAFECRFPAAKDLVFANNLSNKGLAERDGARAAKEGNVANARPEWFVKPAAGDLHLAATATLPQVKVHADCPDDVDGGKRPARGTDPGADDRTAKQKAATPAKKPPPRSKPSRP